MSKQAKCSYCSGDATRHFGGRLYSCSKCEHLARAKLGRQRKSHKVYRPSWPKKIPVVKGCCVYLWRDGDEVFYVGKGSKSRPWASHQNTPAEQRRKLAGSKFSVEVVQEGLEQKEALQLEFLLICKYQPDCNSFCPFVAKQQGTK